MATTATCPLNKFTSKAFVIHLEDATERVKPIESECKKIGLVHEIFLATDGVKERLPIIPNPEHDKFWNQGNAGLVHTMIRLLTKCLADETVDSILVVEDDAEFDPNFNQVLEENLKHVPMDWEMLFMGMNRLTDGETIGGSIHRVQHKGGYAAHCVAIRRTIFPMLIERFAKYCEPNDVTYSDHIYRRGRTYAFHPNISFQRAGYSYIMRKNVDYTFLRAQ